MHVFEKTKALTLLELLMVITLMSLCLWRGSIGLHAFRTQLLIGSEGLRWRHMLQQARRMAWVTGSDVTLCLFDAQGHCGQGPSSHWAFLFSKEGAEDSFWEGTLHHARLTWKGFQSKDPLIFHADLLHSHSNGRLFYQEKGSAQPAFSIVLNRQGRARLERFS